MNNEILELSKLIDLYTSGLDLLDDYDHQCVSKPEGSKSIYTIEYKEARHIIDSMKFSNASNVFGLEKEPGKLEGILASINQYVFDKEVYKTIEEKAAYLLYFLIKDHPFVDGCKRIAATLFLEFLNRNNKLIRNGELIISNKTLVAITLLTAESLPDEMETIIRIIMHLLTN